MQNCIVRFIDLENKIPGESKLFSEAMGMVTYVGTSAEGDAIVQIGDNFTTLPEVSFNIMGFQSPFQEEFHLKYIREIDLAKLHQGEKFLQLDLSDEADMIYEYEVAINIRKVYNVLGDDSEG